MTTKDWLSRAIHIDNEINQLLEEKTKVLSRATKSTTSLKSERVQTSRNNSSESKFLNYVAYSEIIDSRIDELYKTKRETVSAIWKMKNRTLRMLLFAKYIQGKSWEQVAEIIHRQDVKWVRTGMHSKALNEVGEFIPPPDTL